MQKHKQIQTHFYINRSVRKNRKDGKVKTKLHEVPLNKMGTTNDSVNEVDGKF